MQLNVFIKENKSEIDRYIQEALGNEKFKLNNKERRLWILNDEKLYNWAKYNKVAGI